MTEALSSSRQSLLFGMFFGFIQDVFAESRRTCRTGDLHKWCWHGITGTGLLFAVIWLLCSAGGLILLLIGKLHP
jgi:hypothetical protein